MSLRSKALALVEVLLRVPPLFVVDEFLKISLGLPVSSGEEVSILSNITLDHIDFSEQDSTYYDANFYNAFFFTFLKFLICCLGTYSCSLRHNICRYWIDILLLNAVSKRSLTVSLHWYKL